MQIQHDGIGKLRAKATRGSQVNADEDAVRAVLSAGHLQLRGGQPKRCIALQTCQAGRLGGGEAAARQAQRVAARRARRLLHVQPHPRIHRHRAPCPARSARACAPTMEGSARTLRAWKPEDMQQHCAPKAWTGRNPAQKSIRGPLCSWGTGRGHAPSSEGVCERLKRSRRPPGSCAGGWAARHSSGLPAGPRSKMSACGARPQYLRRDAISEAHACALLSYQLSTQAQSRAHAAPRLATCIAAVLARKQCTAGGV